MEHKTSEQSILVHLFYRYYNMALETDIPWTINADKQLFQLESDTFLKSYP